MYYKLIQVEKTNKAETFDRESLIGTVFYFDFEPILGRRFYAFHKDKCLITTEVKNCFLRAGGKFVEIETQNTNYSFEKVQ